MKILKYQIYLLFCSIFVLCKASSDLDTSIDFIFSPFYLKKFDITDKQGASTKIKVAVDSNQVFISAGYGGIMVIDGSSNEILFQQSANEFLNSVEATSDGKYVMFSNNKRFTIFEFKNRNSLIEKASAQFPSSITDIFLNSNEQIAYAIGLEGKLVAYDISNKENINIIGSFEAESNIIHQGSISSDNKWILLGNDLKGLSILRIYSDLVNNTQRFSLAGEGIGIWKMWASILTRDMKYVYALDNWNGIFIYDFQILTSSDESSYPVAISFERFWPFLEINPSVYSLCLTNDDNYLVVGVRSQGVYIFNIKNKTSPVFLQGIYVGAHAFSVALSSNQQYLYFANAQSIFVFQSVSQNLNNNYPNLFNTHQANLQTVSPAFYKWRCYIKEINSKNIYFGAYDAYGIYFLDVTDPYKIEQIYQDSYDPASLVDSLEISPDNKYLYVPLQEDDTAIQILDISDLQNPIEVFRLQKENPNHAEAIFFSQDKNYMVLSYDNGILLIDTKLKDQIRLLDYWKILPNMIGEQCGLMITNDNQWIIGVVRGYGLFLLNANIKTALQFEDSIQTLGAEGIIPSEVSNDYAFFYDGFQGIALVDLTQLPKLVILSRLSLAGWANQIVPVQNDTYLIVVQLESGMISLVDMRNKLLLKIISSYQYKQQSAQSLCMTPDSKYIFINNNSGVIVLPLKSEVNIHTEVQQIITAIDGTQTVVQISKDTTLKVGQTIQFNFVPIYPKEGMEITSVTFYEQEQIKILPFWMKYDQNKRNLLLTVDKSGLGESHSEASLNTVILKSVIPIQVQDLIFNTDIKTTEAEATLIHEYLKSKKLIDNNGLVTDYFEPKEPLAFEIIGLVSSQRLFDLVKLTLQQGVYYNPVLFYIEPSLTLDLKDSSTPIKTLSSTIELYLVIDQSDGKFVMSEFAGVIASMTDEQNQLKLEGSLDEMNRALAGQLILANKKNAETTKVKITIVDNVNYQISQYYLITECLFIKLKQQLKKNKSLTLQQQFNRVYLESVINIQEEFSIDFSSNSFEVSDATSFTYNVTILQNNNYVELSADHWIQVKSSTGSLNIHGTPPVSSFQQIHQLRVTATDGYTSDYSDFSISTSGLPFAYVFNLLVKILGPIFAVFGAYKYKGIILNLVFKKRVFYSPDIVQRGESYSRKLTVLGDDIQKCQLLFSGLLNRFFIDRAKSITSVDDCRNILERFNSEDLNSLEKKSPDLNSKSIHRSKRFISQKYISDENGLRRLKVLGPNDENERLKATIKVIQDYPRHLRHSSFEIEYLKENGSVCTSKILRDIVYKNITFTLTAKTYMAKQFLTDFKNKSSRIFKGIKALAARHFLKMDQRSFEVYSYLKHYAINLNQFSPNDWYRALVDIEATDDIDCYGYPVPFSKLHLKDDVINRVFIDLLLHNQLGQPLNSVSEHDINFHLIKEVLFADTYGLVDYIPSSLSPCVGESIHIHPYEIGSVEAFKHINNTWCMSLRKLLNFDYLNYGVSKNMTLPNWIQFDHKHGVITLTGTPLSQDVEELLIRIIDIDQFVIKQYFFLIVDETTDTTQLAEDKQDGENQFQSKQNQKQINRPNHISRMTVSSDSTLIKQLNINNKVRQLGSIEDGLQFTGVNLNYENQGGEQTANGSFISPKNLYSRENLKSQEIDCPKPPSLQFKLKTSGPRKTEVDQIKEEYELGNIGVVNSDEDNQEGEVGSSKRSITSQANNENIVNYCTDDNSIIFGQFPIQSTKNLNTSRYFDEREKKD